MNGPAIPNGVASLQRWPTHSALTGLRWQATAAVVDPNALAVAAGNPGRCTIATIISPDGPYALLGDDFWGKMRFPKAAEDKMSFVKSLGFTQQAVQNLKDSYQAMKNEERRRIALADIQWAVNKGFEGCAMDTILEASLWDFHPQDVKQSVLLWHGTDDESVPVEASHELEKLLPNVTATFMDGENHTLIRRHWGVILKATVEAARMSDSKL